mmetsp:Transcript_90140/g.232674  ORF Transcript_90140/g.232674 Transcript_90140/m.232674 type:complete len:99 (+) Transcript_90140:701-997(+)
MAPRQQESTHGLLIDPDVTEAASLPSTEKSTESAEAPLAVVLALLRRVSSRLMTIGSSEKKDELVGSSLSGPNHAAGLSGPSQDAAMLGGCVGGGRGA